MKDAKLYIFDMDGTLLDSMPAWTHLGRNYLIQEKIAVPENLEQIIESMTLTESAAYFQTLGLQKEKFQIIDEIMGFIREEYRSSIPAKAGMPELLAELSQKRDRILCVLTTSEKDCAVNALKRLNLLSYFQDIYTSEELNMNKRSAEIYQYICSKYRTSPADTVVLEDALYAIRAAKEAGCYVYAVPDDASHAEWEEIQTLADEILTNDYPIVSCVQIPAMINGPVSPA